MDRHYEPCPSCDKPKKKGASLCRKCAPPPNKGRVFSAEWREKLSLARAGRKFGNRETPYPQEEAHGNWKGERVCYEGLHMWVRKHLGTPQRCEFCKRTDLKHRQYHWANKSNTYKRVLSDWLRLCVKCHKQYDKK